VPVLADVVAAIEEWFDPRWAESWDATGLTCGDPAEAVERVVLAVDAVPETVSEAQRAGAQLLFTHHPLLLSAVHTVAATGPKGALVHRLIRGGVAHYAAHTSADVADPGVSDALADRLGLTALRPLEAMALEAPDKLVVFVPTDDTARMVDALAQAGAGRIGDYERCAWTTIGVGTFRPTDDATPAIGHAGQIEAVAETRVEMVVPRPVRHAVLDALRRAHPYEEPAFDLYPQVSVAEARGNGRVGELAVPTTLRDFVRHAADVLPRTVWGVRAAGDPDRQVRTVAVCGGAGAPHTDDARDASADAYLTADLKHHRTLDAVTEHGPDAMALVDVAHWASEAPWLDAVAGRLRERFGTTVDVTVSTVVTDPWTLHESSASQS
jgi:dinuclear metal center YbgI/SA1388 family protein